MKKYVAVLMVCVMGLGLTACEKVESSKEKVVLEQSMRIITDGANRQVEIPETVESIVCVGVGALRYTCYMEGEDLVVGVEKDETSPETTLGVTEDEIHEIFGGENSTILTEEEKAMVVEGADCEVTVSVSDVTEAVATEVATKVQKLTAGFDIGQYLQSLQPCATV